MKKFFKKSLAILLVLSLFSTLPMVTLAAGEEDEKTVYDFSEAFEVDMTNYSFEGANAEGTTVYQNLPLKYANSEESTSPWKVGYFSLNNNNAFTFFEYMSRCGYTSGRAPEDTVTAQTIATRLAFGRSTTYKSNASGTEHGYEIGYQVGYAFGNNTQLNSFPGAYYGTYAKTRNAVRFVAPKSGIVVPTVKMAENNASLDDSVDGVLFKIYKQSGDTQTPVIGGDITTPFDNTSGWTRIPEGNVLTTWEGDAVSVAQGDEIVLIFDPYANTNSDEFCINSYQIEYVDPIAAYDTDTFLSYQTGKVNTVDLTRAPVIDSLGGTITYSLEDTGSLLTATSTPGFYTLTGVTNYDGESKGTPAVLTASYTPAGAAEPSCTTSTNIYVGTLKTSYDYNEGFAIDVSKYSFEGYAVANTTVYKNLSEGLKYENSEESTSPWKYGYFSMTDGTFKFSTHLSKGWYTSDRAPEDTVSPASRQTVLSFGYETIYKGPYGGEYGWQTAYPTIGSSFGNNTSANSHSGNVYQKQMESAVRFVAPRAGLVTPRVELYDENRGGYDGVFFKVYKKGSDGAKTVIYGGENSITRDSTSGWDVVPEGTTYVREGAAISVAKGEEIVLHFNPGENNSVDEFSLVSYTIDYLPPIDEYSAETFGYYEEGGKNLLDLTLDKTVPADTGTIVYTIMDSTGALTATDKPGVYTMTGVINYADNVKGTPIKVVASYYAEGESAQTGAIPAYTSTTDLYIGEKINTYDFDDAFRIKDYTFTADNMVADYNAIEPKYENSETSTFPWKVGYITVANGDFNYYPYLNRSSTYDRVIEDTVNMTKTLRVGYGKTKDEANGCLSGYAYFGYSYKSDTASGHNWNAFSGNYANKERPTLRFIVPRDGVINPVLKLADNVAVDYAGSDGVLVRVYKKSGSTTTTIYGGEFTAGMDNSTGWDRIPGGNVLTTWDDAKVAVKAGDEIVLQIDPYGSHSSDEYNFHSYVLNYVDAIETYEEETYTTYDATKDNTLDLTLEKYVTDGTIEYTTVDTIGALTETDTPGVYTVKKTNYDGTTLSTPVTVTASYYAEGESAANGDTPIVSTTTTVYIASALYSIEPFGHYTVGTTNLDMAYDTFFLPYYTDANERELYGTIDLDLHERWAGATITFDKSGYLEDKGDGLVKVTGLYDHSQSAPAAVDSTDIKTGTSFKAQRDENTVGTPIKMTVTAPDGFSRHYYVLTFKAIVQNIEQDGHDVYRWIYGPYRRTNNRVNNAVMGFEAVYGRDNAFTFSPMVPDPGALSEGAMIALEAAGEKYASSWRGARVDTYNRLGVSTMGEAFDISTYGNHIGAVGVAQTFTAPKSGTVEVTGFLPAIYPWQSQYIATQGLSATAYINLYDENGDLIDTLYKASLSPTEVNGVYGAWQLGEPAYGEGVLSHTDDALVFSVEKGQKVRVFTEYPDMSGLTSGRAGLEIQRNADPVFTYLESELDAPITATGTGTITSSASATIAPVLDGGTYAYFGYDADGKLVGSGYQSLAAGATTLAPLVTGDAAVDYFKIFIWSDLNTLKSVGGALILR